MVKLALVTGSRAEWGILEPLARRLQRDPDIDLCLIVTGAHLSPEYGATAEQIALPIAAKIECVLSSDTPTGASRGTGLAIISFAEVYARLEPDLVMVLGDRYEILASVIAAHMARIPVAHIHGGDVTGNYDDAFRHAITKMAQIHFPACESARHRIIQLGERPDTVFDVGCLGCDGLYRQQHGDGRLVVIYHPVTLGDESIDPLIAVLSERPEHIVFIRPNADNGAHAICRAIDRFAANYPLVDVHTTLRRKDFIALLREASAIVGNSSAGILEAPALGVPTINIGQRQAGREKAASVIDCTPDAQSIRKAFEILYSEGFMRRMEQGGDPPYKGGDVADRIISVIKAHSGRIRMGKGFYDLP